jgi:hypothetical protein
MEKSFNLKADWETVKEKIKESNVEISDGDLEYDPGNEDELFNRLSQKLHMPKEEIKGWIESISVNKSMAG